MIQGSHREQTLAPQELVSKSAYPQASNLQLGNPDHVSYTEIDMDEKKSIDRHGFLGISTGIIAGIIGATLGIPSVAYLIGPALKSSRSQTWTRIGPASKVELGAPTLFKVKIERQTGWIVDSEEISIYVLTDNGRDYIAMSNICTHLGCRARWVSDQEQFYCPCHAGVFDREGYVVSGPPPRPLDRYEVKVEDGQIYIGQLYKVEG